MIHIDVERPGDAPAREALLDRCFGKARHFKTSARLRRGRLPANGLALAARAGGHVVGTVRLWHVDAGSAGAALLLGPIAVAPERQGDGLGGLLMRHAVAEARSRGHRAIVLVGDAPYYARFGFDGGLTAGLDLPGPVDRARFLGLELQPGALAGASGLVTTTGLPVPARRRAAPVITPLAA